jgi:hypothetical protein
LGGTYPFYLAIPDSNYIKNSILTEKICATNGAGEAIINANGDMWAKSSARGSSVARYFSQRGSYMSSESAFLVRRR